MRILGLDLGNKTGWSLFDDGVITHGVWINYESSKSRFEGAGMRYISFTDSLDRLPRPDRVYFEEVRSHRRAGQISDNVGAAQVYGAYLAILSVWCEQKGIPYGSFGVSEIKKRATGKGNANKELVMEAAAKISRHAFPDDNEADAFWAMIMGCEAAGIAGD